MASPDELADTEFSLPSLEDYQEMKGATGRRAPIGRPRINPLATQQQVRKFEVEARRRERDRLYNARAERKAEIDDYVDQLFEAHPDIQELLISIVQHVYEYARRDEDPLTEYDARTHVMRSVVGRIKHLTSREETIKFLQAQHEAQVTQEEPVTASDEVPVTPQESPSAEDEDLEAMMAEGLPGGDYDDETDDDGMMSYPKDWKIG